MSDLPVRHRPAGPRRVGSYRLGALLVIAFGVCALVLAVDVSLGSLTAPGPGLWPFIAALITLGCGATLLVVDPKDDYESWTRAVSRPLTALAALVVFVLLFEHLSFVIPALLLMGFWLRVVARESWTMTLLLSVCGVAVLNLVFGTWLGVPFPVPTWAYDLGLGGL